MKKLFVFLAVAMLFLFAGCSSEGAAQSEYDALKAELDKVVAERDALLDGVLNDVTSQDSVSEDILSATLEAPKESYVPIGMFDEATVLSQLDVTTYAYSNDYWDYAFLVIKNNSQFNLELSAAVKFYNAAGQLIGAKDASERPFEHGTETILIFNPDEAFATMEYELSVCEEEFFECVVSDLSCESTAAKDKEIVSVTNNGTEAAEFVQGYAMFFYGDKLVDHDYTYFIDDDNELKPGKTITKELSCYEPYDSVKFYLTGRR